MLVYVTLIFPKNHTLLKLGSGRFWWSLPFIVQKRVLGSSPDSIPPDFVTVFKSVVPSTRLGSGKFRRSL